MKTLFAFLFLISVALGQEYAGPTNPSLSDGQIDHDRKINKILNDSRTGANPLNVAIILSPIAQVVANGEFNGTVFPSINDNQMTSLRKVNKILNDARTGSAPLQVTGIGGVVTIDASGFNGNLTTDDDTIQEVAQKVDDLTFSGTFGETSLAGLVNNQTLWNGANATRTLTLNVSGTDSVITVSSGVINISTGALQVGGSAVLVSGGAAGTPASINLSNGTALPVASVTGTFPVSQGGTGQTTYTNGQLLIGNTSGNTLTKATLTGTANQVVVTNGNGTITLSLPQDIGTGSSPAFGGITLTGAAILPAATTSIPSLRVPHGVAPSSPTNGDIWTTTAGLYIRINGVTVGPLGTGGSVDVSADYHWTGDNIFDKITFGSINVGTSRDADDTYTGIVRIGLNNSGGVTQWDAVYLNSSSAWVKADADGSGTYPCRGIAVATASDGVATTIITRGTVRNDSWTWTPGGTIYLSTTAGGLTQTAPSTTGDKVQVIGYALDADTMAVEISTDYGTAP